MAPEPRLYTMHELDRPTKRLRLNDECIQNDHKIGSGKGNGKADNTSHDPTTISISTSPESASLAVSPFLSKHIPGQYAPQGQPDSSNLDYSTRYCYRHRPDLKCRRQVDEPSMDILQRVSHGDISVRYALMFVQQLQTLPQNDQLGITYVWALFSASPAMQRQLMLQGILTQCCFPQLSFLSNSIRDLIRIDFLSALPSELGFKILCHLDTVSLCKAAQVSQRWRQLADDDSVWRTMCEQHIGQKCTKCGWGLPAMDRERLRASRRQHQLQRANRQQVHESSVSISPESSPEPSRERSITPLPSPSRPNTMRCRPWKDVYRDRFKVGSNWRHGRCSTKVFKGHTNGVMCLQVEGNILATGSYDCTIKIWDIELGKEMKMLTGHSCGVRCLQFDDSKLISGSLDKTIKIWNWRTGECVRTLSGHAAGIISLHFAGSLLVSGSIDHTLRLWNFEEKTSHVLKGHTDWVNAVKIDSASRTVLSASDDLTLRLWDLDTRTCLQVFKGHIGQVQQVVPLPHDFEVDEKDIAEFFNEGENEDIVSRLLSEMEAFDSAKNLTPPSSPGRAHPPRYILSSGLDGMIKLWDVHKGKCLRSFFGHVEGVWALAADSLRMVSGAEDRMVKVWDTRTGRCEKTFTGHAAAVTCIGLTDSSICTGSEDCEVRLLSFGVGTGSSTSG